MGLTPNPGVCICGLSLKLKPMKAPPTLALVLALLAPAMAASQAAAPVPNHLYVEAHRPHLAPRALTAAEKAALRPVLAKATAKIVAREADLDALRPYAEAGDPAALKAMAGQYWLFNYNFAADRRDGLARVADPEKAAKALAAQWAVAAWQVSGPDKDLSISIYSCLTGLDETIAATRMRKASSLTRDNDCGFDITTPDSRSPISSDIMYFRRAEMKSMVFIQRPIADASGREAARFAAALAEANATKATNDRVWVEAYVANRPEDKAKYLAAINIDTSRYPEERRMFDAKIGSAGPMDANALWVIARRDPITAQQWWDRFGNPAFGGVLSDYCLKGVKAACEQPFQSRPAAPVYTGAFAATPYNGAAATQALKDQQNSVNQQNCTRADKGASIACGR